MNIASFRTAHIYKYISVAGGRGAPVSSARERFTAQICRAHSRNLIAMVFSFSNVAAWRERRLSSARDMSMEAVMRM